MPAASLRREEWDFSNVPDAELETCFVYEFFRETPDMRDMEPFLSMSHSKRASQFERLRKLGLTPYEQFRRVPTTSGVAYLTTRLQQFLALIHITDNSSIVANYVIDWSRSDTEIISDVGEWLKRHRPTNIRESRRGIKRNSLRVNLERLGIMRLLHHHRPSEIRENAAAWKLFSSREYFKERKRARDTFFELFPPKHNDLEPASWPTKAGRSK